jgi:hypothetical protein
MKNANLYAKIVIIAALVGAAGLGVFYTLKSGALSNLSKGKPVAVENNTENKQPTASPAGNAPMLDRAIQPVSEFSSSELVSPDGEWYFAGQKYFGEEPFSRDQDWRLEFVNLKGGGNRYVYEDWFERPEDGVYYDRDRSIHPLGWSADGNSVYYANVQPLSKIVPGLPEQLLGYWAPAVDAVRFNLGNSDFTYSNFNSVSPIESNGKGYLLDLLSKEDRALWFEPAQVYPPCGKMDICENASAPGRLIYFDPSNNKEIETVTEWPVGFKGTVISASLDRDSKVKRVAYVVHEDGKSDQAYLFEDDSKTKTTEKMDLAPYAKEMAKNGIQTPYRLVVEKTAMDLPGGMFLVVVGKNEKVMYFRFDKFSDKWTVEYDNNGIIL